MWIRTIAAVVGLVAATVPAAQAEAAGVRFLGEAILPHKLDYQGTTVGGISGIDRDPRTGEYVLMSDDRSYLQPARFYTAKIDVDRKGIRLGGITGTHALRQPDGSTHPAPPANDGKAIDPEEIRVDPQTGNYWWSQEGNRPKKAGDPDPVIQPSIQVARRDGGYVRSLPLPENYRITMQERGPRRNLVLEAITFSNHGELLTSVMEGPLIQDGPEPTTKRGALARVTVQTRTGRVLSQYAYPLEPLFAEPDPTSPYPADTGVPAVLADPQRPGRYFTLERTWVPGANFKVRLFEFDIRGATDVKRVDSLANTQVKPVRKRLVADLHNFPLSVVDNNEGLTWGPRLSTGERTLVLVSDDNFAKEEVTQFIALAVR